MTLARRYKLLQTIVWVQCLFCVAFGVYVLVASKKQEVIQVEYHEPSQVDLSFLDMITNRPPAFPLQDPNNARMDTPSGQGGNYTPIFDLPLVFDGYFVNNGVQYVSIRGFYYKAGDTIHGRMINSISPQFVEIEGRFCRVLPTASNTPPNNPGVNHAAGLSPET